MFAFKAPRRLVLILAVISLTGCTPIVENSLKQQLSKKIGPAKNYDVKIDGLELGTGEADQVAIVGQRVQPQGAPVIDRLTIDLRDIKYNRKEKHLERLVGIAATAQIKASDIATFLETQRNLPNTSVSLWPPDRATVRVRKDLSLLGRKLPVGLTADASGQLSKTNDRIYFTVSDVRAAGINLGDQPAQLLSQAINPLVDLSDLPLDVSIKTLRVENNTVQIELTGDPARLFKSHTLGAWPLSMSVAIRE